MGEVEEEEEEEEEEEDEEDKEEEEDVDEDVDEENGEGRKQTAVWNNSSCTGFLTELHKKKNKKKSDAPKH